MPLRLQFVRSIQLLVLGESLMEGLVRRACHSDPLLGTLRAPGASNVWLRTHLNPRMLFLLGGKEGSSMVASSERRDLLCAKGPSSESLNSVPEDEGGAIPPLLCCLLGPCLRCFRLQGLRSHPLCASTCWHDNLRLLGEGNRDL